MMLKVLVLCTLFTSLVSAGFFTPSPEKDDSNDAVREGHYSPGVVIGFEKEDGNTKVSISPNDANFDNIPSRSIVDDDEKGDIITTTKEKLSEAKQKLKDATTSSVLPEKVRETARKASEKARETTEKARETVHETKESAKDASKELKQGVERKAEGTKEKAKEKAEGHKGILSPPTRVLSSLSSVVHLMGFATAYGMSVWVTFASSYVLAGALPRQQFAMVQSKIYPAYFRAMACSVGMGFLGNLLSQIGNNNNNNISKGMFGGGGLSLLTSLVMILVNMFYLEPRTTKVMFERMKKEKEEGVGKEGPVEEMKTDTSGEKITSSSEEGGSKEKQPHRIVRTREILSRRLNSNSSLLNVATLMSLTWHLVHLAQKLHSVC